MDSQEIRKLDIEKIRELVAERQEELANLTLEVNSGEEKDYSKLGKVKKEIARLLTIQREKELLEELKNNQ